MAPPLLPRPEAVTEAAAEADKDVQPPPADEDVVLWAGDEPDTSETSVEVDMGESICWGPLALPPDDATFCLECMQFRFLGCVGLWSTPLVRPSLAPC